jgi:hypothetical protein
VSTQDDDLLCSETPRRDHTAEADSAVADHDDALPGSHAGAERRVVAGGHHVGEGQERRHEGVVWLDR